ncbi:hypothetical protein M422DRAFT_38852 [Sphaerobolus stellatus SS14]|uniref:Uncharacterized protein n=1 Tax=Sphaerobolus stellatus (strain SS14) TaxID=990650 RepID=A0A0C9TTR5_SPHS4|nr:hypothetical protein M422DRAFT_38852 [Sphaerobolus stellatus SS14]
MAAWWNRVGELERRTDELEAREAEMTKWDFAEEVKQLKLEVDLWVLLEPFEEGEEEE